MMVLDLVGYENKVCDAVRTFWGNQDVAKHRQIGSDKPNNVEQSGRTATKNMDGFITLIQNVICANGLGQSDIHLNRSLPSLPGSYWPTKRWDLFVIHKSELIAAIALVSQVGPSIGNHFNNRKEEALGRAHDFLAAYREGSFGKISPPFVGLLLLVEDGLESRSKGASYLQRYELLCQKLTLERLYTTAALIASPRKAVGAECYSSLSPMTSLKTFVTSLAGHVAAAAARLG